MIKITLLLVAIIGLSFQCPDERFCRACNGDICLDCQSSFFYNKKCQFPETIEQVSHCSSYKSKKLAGEPTQCEYCDFGYKLNGKSCSVCKVSNCAICNDSDCDACFNGVPTLNSVTQKIECKTKIDFTDHCKINFTTERCDLCEDGFYLNSKSDSCVKGGVPFCWKSTTADKCDYCREGFYITSTGKCITNWDWLARYLWYLVVGVIVFVLLVVIGVIACCCCCCMAANRRPIQVYSAV